MKMIHILLVLLAVTVPAQALVPPSPRDVSVEIVADDGRVFPVHGLYYAGGENAWRGYLEAIQGGNYGIRVRNLSARRLGLVIAVDGRNIISGQQSSLLPGERMYILGPWEQATYEGWRTSNRKVNRFYFTDAGDSYAGAFEDYSAMGVIALAVYPERGYRLSRPKEQKSSRHSRDTAKGRADAPAAPDSRSARESLDSAAAMPGTGFGEEQYSRARVVQFNPVQVASSRYFLKYEWRETLCDVGLIACGRRPENRFWPGPDDQYGYAPYPPPR